MESSRIESLLEQIRDVQREHLAEYKAQAARSQRLAEESVAKQKEIGAFYKRVVIGSLLFVVLAVAVGAWIASSLS